MVYLQRGRSNSDGTVVPLNENADAFPSLPNSVLEKLGLYGCNNSRFDIFFFAILRKFSRCLGELIYAHFLHLGTILVK